MRGKPSWAFYASKKPQELLVKNYLGKYKVGVNTSIDIERRLISGSYEPETQAMIARFVKAGETCLDVGANVGAVSLALANAVGAGGKVHAFEPGPIYFSRLRRNIELNPGLAKTITTHAVGLSDKPGKLFWQQSTVYTGTASMYHGVQEEARAMLELPVVKLDDFAPIAELDKIHFMKIDVDGLEFQIMSGARETLKKHKPIIYFETTMWNDEMKEAARRMEELLIGIGYDIYKIDGRKFTIAKTRFPNYSFNSLALPVLSS